MSATCPRMIDWRRVTAMSRFCYDRLKGKWLAEQSERKKRSDRWKAALLTRGEPVFRKFGIEKVWLFGSVICGHARETSDIDILAIPLQTVHYWAFRHELEEAVSLPVDLYTQEDDPVFIDKIMKRGEVIYEI